MKFGIGTAVVFVLFSGWSWLEASDSYCRVKHPAHYFESLGRRHHDRYGSHHFRQYHGSRRAIRGSRSPARSYYRGQRSRSRLYRGRSSYRPYVYRPSRYYRRHGHFSFRYHHRRPHFSLHLNF